MGSTINFMLCCHQGFNILALYITGDILDRAIFPRFNTKKNRWTGWNWITDKKSIDQTRLKAQAELEVKGGIYKLCKLISDGIDTPSAYRIRIENELAKFFRSLIIPLVFYGAWKIYSSNLYFGICCILVSIIFIKVYGSLKGSHMIRLYKRVVKLVAEKKSYQAIPLNERIRLHLWDGKLLTSSRVEK